MSTSQGLLRYNMEDSNTENIYKMHNFYDYSVKGDKMYSSSWKRNNFTITFHRLMKVN